MTNEQNTVKTAMEIGNLASVLEPQNQVYVLNTINALLFAQESTKKQSKESA